MEIELEADIKKLTRNIRGIQRKQIPFALAQAVTWTAQDVRTELYQSMRRIFDRPTKAIVPADIKNPKKKGALFLQAAKTKHPVARVWVKDKMAKFNAERVLLPHIEGGRRKHKPFERGLIRAGILPPGKFTAPAVGAKRNKFGNMSQGQIVQILSGVRASPDPMQNVTGKSRKKKRRDSFFVMYQGGTATGIWKRTGKRIAPVLNFIAPPMYAKRLHFAYIAKTIIKKRFPKQFEKSFSKALATAK